MPVNKKKQNTHNDLVGVIPAAGTGSRLGALPCSKELLPVGFQKNSKGEPSQPKAVSHYLLERMQTAEVSTVYIILRRGKWDIPGYFGDGKMLDMSIAYLLMDLPFGVPFTVDQAYPFIKESLVVFGFPDIIIEPENAFQRLLIKQNESNADIVLGLFEAKHPSREDMVGIDRSGRMNKIEIKSSITKLKYTWLIAVWSASFTDFLHKFVSNWDELYLNQDSERLQEVFMGDVIKEAMRHKLDISSVTFEKGRYLDMGSLDNLSHAYQFPLNRK